MVLATTFEGTLQGWLEGSLPRGKGLSPLEAPLKPFSSPQALEAPWGWIRAATFKGTLQGGLEGSLPGGGTKVRRA